jgi:hypothetical protein
MLVEGESGQVSRGVQIIAGILLGLFTLFCLAGLAAIIFTPNSRSPILAPAIGLVFVAASAWVLEKCVRLVIGRKQQGGLMSPIALRVVGWLFLLFPVAGIFTGYYRAHPTISLYQVGVNISIFFGLHRLAAVRSASSRDSLKDNADDHVRRTR